MRITPELLRKLAVENVKKRLVQQKDVVAVYLTGSVLSEEPLLGGTTDIDMVFVHKEDPPLKREIQRISYEVSFDIVHHHQSFYTFHRRLRLNPWLGYPLCNHESILYDTDHWLEFIQAGVFSQFNRPENIYERSQPLAEKARSIWFELEEPQEHEPLAWFEQYFKAVELAANAIAVLNGPALPQRRFLIDFPARAEAVGKSGLYQGLLGMIGAEKASEDTCKSCRSVWQEVILAASKTPNFPLDLHPARKAYYLQSCDALLASNNHQAAYWPMLQTWMQAARVLWNVPEQQKAWLNLCSELGFDPSQFEDRVNALDSFLDMIELTLEEWKSQYGL